MSRGFKDEVGNGFGGRRGGDYGVVVWNGVGYERANFSGIEQVIRYS